MANYSGQEIHLQRRPEGIPVAEDFAFVEQEIGGAPDGGILVKNLYISVDPYMRPPMSMAQIGTPLNQVLMGAALGRVVESKHDGFNEGDLVSHGLGWRNYSAWDGAGASKIPEINVPLTVHMGPLGMTGLTAYGGILRIGNIKEGETVFVSGASGAVGSMVAQIAKLRGCKVVASAGTDEKIAHLRDEYSVDAAFNYKGGNILKDLMQAAPEGIDVYFDNVGGEQLEAALIHTRPYARIAICGMIASYNTSSVLRVLDPEGSDDSGPQGPSLNILAVTIYKRVTIRGFVVSEFEDMRSAFLDDMSQWINQGKLKYHETIMEGIESTPGAFAGLFTGANEGKMLVKLADDV